MNLIGALCKKFQFCGTCNCTNYSFSSSCCKHVVIIGNLERPEDVLEAPSLKELIIRVDSAKNLIANKIEVNFISRTEFNNVEQEKRKVLVGGGLCGLVFLNLQVLQKDSGLFFNLEERLARLKLAEHLARVNLEDHFLGEDPICENDKKALEKQVEFVKKFGCYTAYLWAMTQNLTEMQPSLYTKIKDGVLLFQDRLKKPSFALLDLEIQEYFFNKAKKLARDFSELHKNPYILWVAPKDDASTDAIGPKIDGFSEIDLKESEKPIVQISSEQNVSYLMDMAREEE